MILVGALFSYREAELKGPGGLDHLGGGGAAHRSRMIDDRETDWTHRGPYLTHTTTPLHVTSSIHI